MARAKLRPSYEAVDQLEEALYMLRAFLDPDNLKCSLPADIRERASGYLSSWVEGPMTNALRKISPEFDKREDPAEESES